MDCVESLKVIAWSECFLETCRLARNPELKMMKKSEEWERNLWIQEFFTKSLQPDSSLPKPKHVFKSVIKDGYSNTF